MTRRTVIAGFGASLVAPGRPSAQQSLGEISRVGYLSPESSASHEMADLFRDGRKQLGYLEGQNIQIEYRWAAGQFERLPVLATELVDLKVDIIVAAVTQASLAAKAATRTISPMILGRADEVIE